MDMRKYFKPTSKTKAASTVTANGKTATAPVKRKVVSSSSDEDDQSKRETAKPNLKRLKKIGSAEDKRNQKPVQPPKKIDVSLAFGDSSVNRVDRPKRKADDIDLQAMFDADADESLAEIDCSLLEDPSPKKTASTRAAGKSPAKADIRRSPRKTVTPLKYGQPIASPLKLASPGDKDSPQKAAVKRELFERPSDVRRSPRKTQVKSEPSGESPAKKSADRSPSKKLTDRSPQKTDDVRRSPRKTAGKTQVKSEKSSESPAKKPAVRSPAKKPADRSPAKKPADRSPSKKSADRSSQKTVPQVKIEHSDISPPPVDSKPAKAPKKTPKSAKRANTSNLDESVANDEDRFEKKRRAMAQYQSFIQRGGPRNPGSKELPNGKKTCLAGLNFVVTGVLESMERDEACDLIRHHGGHVQANIAKKTSYVVAGEEAGQSKMAKADEQRIPILSEDDLLNMIRSKSGLPTQPVAKAESPDRTTERKQTTAVKAEPHSPPDSVEPKPAAVRVKTEPCAPRCETEHERNIASADNLAWVDKYRPTSVRQIVGQQTDKGNVALLSRWLTNWHANQNGPKKPARPNPWAKNDDGAFFKAALLSGPPGIGKTTTATLVARELGFDVVEFNASDTRSKRLLKEEVAELLSNKSLSGYFRGTSAAVTARHVLLMDEVDGMAGNEDRGGVQELIALIRDSQVPIVCMCNDRNHQKMRSLVNHCFDLRFARPTLQQIKGAMMSICTKEGFSPPAGCLEEIITATNFDIRQTLNQLTMLRASGNQAPIAAGDDRRPATARKDLKLGPWEVVRKVFSADEHRSMSLADKADLFFHDYSMGPLFVQQNYLQVKPNVGKSEVLLRVAMAADSLSRGDLVESRIRSQMAWSMLPMQAMLSSVMPGTYMSGTITGQINFPGWLGKQSKATKRKRMAQELHDHTRIRTSGSRLSVRLDYAPFLCEAIARPMRDHGPDGVDAALELLKHYQLLREDIDSLLELTTWPGKRGAFDGIDGRVKAALTRAYNKDVAPFAHSAMATVRKKRADSNDDESIEGYGPDEESSAGAPASDDDDDDGLASDALIKAKPAKKAPSVAKKPAKPSNARKTTKAK